MLKFEKQGSPRSSHLLPITCSWTSALACLHKLCQSHTYDLCFDCTEMKGRLAEVYCWGNNSVLIKGVFCRTEELNSAIDYHDVCYSERRWKHRGCLHTAFPLSSSRRFSRDFLAIYGATEGFLWLKGFCRRQWYNTSTCYTQEGFLGPKPSSVCFLQWKMTPTVDIHRRKQTYTDIYEKAHTIHCHSLKNSSGGKELSKTLCFLLHSPHTSSFQSTLCGLSNCLVG